MLSRLSFLVSSEREAVYNSFIDNYNEALRDAVARGRHPSKPFELGGEWTVVDREIYEYGDPNDGAVFCDPVYLTTIEKEELVDPIDADTLVSMIKSERDRLQENYKTPFVEKCFSYVGQYLDDNISAMLQEVLPKKFNGNLMAARMDTGNNQVKILDQKIDQVKKFLKNTEIGSTISVSGSEGELFGVVTKIEPPKSPNDYTKLGMYDVSYVVAGDEKPRKTTLASLYMDESFKMLQFGRMGTYEKPDFRAFDDLEKGVVKVQRKILDGNEVLAIKTGAERDLGKATKVTVKGCAPSISVLIPKGKELLVKLTPGVTRDPDVAFDLLREGVDLFTDPVEQKEGMTIRNDGHRLRLRIPGGKALRKKFEDPEIMSLLQGKFEGDWKGCYAYLDVDNYDDFFEVMTRKGFSIYFDCQYRGRAAEITEEILAEKTSNKETAFKI